MTCSITDDFASPFQKHLHKFEVHFWHKNAEIPGISIIKRQFNRRTYRPYELHASGTAVNQFYHLTDHLVVIKRTDKS
jgi:hypothetical protein